MTYTNIDFNNSAARSAYPFAPACSRVDDAGNILPPWFITDIGVMLPAGVGTPYVSSAYIGERLWSATLAAGDGTALLVASVAADRLVAAPGLAVPMQPLRPGVSGSILFGRPEPASDAYASRYTYSGARTDNAQLLPSLVRTARSMPVSSLYTGADVRGAARVAGAVTLAGTGDLVIEPDVAEPGRIVLRLAGNREAYLSVCDRTAGGASDTPVRSVNGVRADASGTLTIRLVAQKEGAQ